MPHDKRFEGVVSAPDFPTHLEWLNTDRAFSLRDFRGKMVLLDFWTYCCINCMHVLPDLKKLEKKYPEELVVIGVHSAKFRNEKGTESIRQAILRYEIEHPVLNDKDLEVWTQFGIHAWPTFVLINPNGKIIAIQSGEGVYDLFDSAIGKAIEYFDQKGQMKRSPAGFLLEASKMKDGTLSFPGKISAHAETNRLFITDSNHNRILVTDAEGGILEVLGSGRAGNKDGDFASAEFNHPQGTFLEEDILYIADTENHTVRAADFKSRTVTTVLKSLNSPWDLLIHDGKMFIAMAGSHQLYVADLKTWKARPFAGSGNEARIDGPLLSAALAQPSGITTDGKKLFFADSEVSSIRSADLDPSGNVETLIGEDLFEFGDIDGGRDKARLQHALGVAYHEGLLYVADTYNSKIKIIDPVKKTATTLAGTGEHGAEDGAFDRAQFFEPGGLAFLQDQLFVADTNNHLIRILDLQSRQAKTLPLSNLEMLKPIRTAGSGFFGGRKVELPLQKIKEGKGLIRLILHLPEGYKLTEEAPFTLNWKSSDGSVFQFDKSPEGLKASEIRYPFEIPVTAALGDVKLSIEADIYYCREQSAICHFDSVHLTAPVQVTGDASPYLSLPIEVKPPAP